jgi:hypothetical protein
MHPLSSQAPGGSHTSHHIFSPTVPLPALNTNSPTVPLGALNTSHLALSPSQHSSSFDMPHIQPRSPNACPTPPVPGHSTSKDITMMESPPAPNTRVFNHFTFQIRWIDSLLPISTFTHFPLWFSYSIHGDAHSTTTICWQHKKRPTNPQ